jgi:ribosomal protein S18 acetylase RimI-like enzyme
VRTLEPARSVDAIEMLTVAFDGDPMFRFLLPQAEPRRRWLRAIMGGAVSLTLPDGWALAAEGERVPGVILYVPPRRYPPPSSRIAGSMLRSPPPWPTLHFLRTGLRVLSAMERLHPKTPHYYVMTLGVHPAQQGKGFARKLVSSVTSRADDECVSTYLETTNPTNLPIYRKLGFDIVGEHILGAGYPPLWTMQRPVFGRASG